MIKKQILVVEDEFFVATAIKKILSKDYTTLVVSTGEEAVQQAVKTCPALILMDIQLSGDMDGIEAADQINAQLDVPLLFLTAYTDNRLLQRAKTTGPYGYLFKPFKSQELLVAVEIALYKHKLAKELKQELEQHVADRTAELQVRVTDNERLSGAMSNLLQDLQASHHLLEKTSGELEHANKLLTALGQVAIHLQTSLDPDRMLEILGAQLKQLELTSFVLLLDQDQELVLYFLAVEAVSLARAEAAGGVLARGFRLPRDHFPHYTALVEERQEVFVASGTSRQLAAWLPNLPETQIETILHWVGITDNSRLVYLPLTIEERMLGVFGLWGETLQKADLPALSIFAGQVAAALEVAHLHEQLKAEHIAEQSALLRLSQALLGQLDAQSIMELAVRKAAESLAAEFAAISLVDVDGQHYSDRAGFGWPPESLQKLQNLPLDGSTAMGHVILSRTPFSIPDTRLEHDHKPPPFVTELGVKAVLIVPLLVAGEVIGGLVVDSREPRSWTEDEVRLLSLLANQIAQALERTRLFEAERQQRLQAETLREATLALTAQTGLSAVLDEILNQVERLTPYQTANIAILEDDVLRIMAWRGYDFVNPKRFQTNLEQQPLARFPLDRRASHSGQPVIIVDTHNEPDWTTFDQTLWIRSCLVIPIRLHNQTLGLLRLDGAHPGEFSLEDAERLKPLANAAAIALENAYLFEQMSAAHKQLRSLASHLETALENERTRIARELHDEFGQALTAMRFDLSWLAKNQPHTTFVLTQKIEEILSLVDSTMQMVRRVATQLRPDILDDLGLTAALEWQAEEFTARTGLTCELNLGREDVILERDMSTAVFRTFQETLTNIARHAAASRVWVTLEDRPAELVLVVRDNGRGISDRQKSSAKSLGIVGMQERARAWNGQITFQGQPDHGTTVTLRIPRQPDRSESEP
jgi:signal transduction histidine kinase/DNA-binding response OmpR family regulator